MTSSTRSRRLGLALLLALTVASPTAAANHPPTISTIGSQTTVEDTPIAPLAFTIGDADTAAESLTIAIVTSDPSLLPPSNIKVGGSGAHRTVAVVPARDRSGTARVTLTVSDGVADGSTSFQVTVVPVDDPPTISEIADQQTIEGTPTATIPFTIGDPDNPAPSPALGLALSGTSSNPALVPPAAIRFGGSSTQRTVQLTPALGQSGVAVIAVTVTDATGLRTSESFTLAVDDVPCAYTLAPSSPQHVGAAGQTVIVDVAARPACGWTARSDVAWATVTAPASLPAFGNGGVAIAVAANPGKAVRTARVSIGSATFVIEQAAISCAYAVSATPSALSPRGGSGILAVVTPPGCTWDVSGGAPWLIVAPAPPGGGTGSVAFTASVNDSGQPRAVVLTVGGQRVDIAQSIPATAADVDGDGLPDAWETQFGLSASSIARDDSPAGDPDGDGVSNLQEHRDGTHPRGFETRLLAEGASGGFFETVVALVNPDRKAPARVLLRFSRPDASVVSHFVLVPALARRTVTPGSIPGLQETAFSTSIESDVPVIVDRTMTWDATGYGAHSEASVTAPQATWYFAEGATHSGFDLFYLLQNPSPDRASTVRITYLRPSPLPPLAKVYELAPSSRTTIWVDAEQFPGTAATLTPLADTDVSAVIEVVEGPPIAAERSMYLSRPGQFFAAGHASAGVAAPATLWFLAEGATGAFFDEFVLVANPATRPARIRATFLLPGGRSIQQDYDVGPQSRFTLWLDVEEIPRGSGRVPLADTAVSTLVRSLNDVPVIVERAMWWPGGADGWIEAHGAAGATSPGTQWGAAEGEVGGRRGASTYVLVANTSPFEARALVTLLFENGTTAERTFAIPAGSRFTVDIEAQFAGLFPRSDDVHRFGTLVESLGADGQAPAALVVERATYWDAGGVFWAAGTSAVATRLR